MIRKLSALVAAALCALPSVGAAQEWSGPPHPHLPPMAGPPFHPKKVLRDIGLSDAQVKRFEELRFAADRKRIDIEHELAQARLTMQQILSRDAPDKSAVFAQIDKIGALDVELKKNRMGLLLEVRKLMTPAQWEKWKAAQPRMRMRMRRFGPGPVPPMPPPPPMPPEP